MWLEFGRVLSGCIAGIVRGAQTIEVGGAVGEAGVDEAGGGTEEDLRAAGAGGGDGAGGEDELVGVGRGEAAAGVGEAGPAHGDLGAARGGGGRASGRHGLVR